MSGEQRDEEQTGNAAGQRAGFPETSVGPDGEGRREVGSAAGSQRHPPHVTPNDEGAPVQQSNESPDEVPVLPANAGGRDIISSEEQRQPIDDESMYDRRPSQDKDQPPGKAGRAASDP